jgi:hypothetical protein
MTLNVPDPTIIDVAGRPWWLFADGTRLPVVRGGADDDSGDKKDDGGADDKPDDKGDDTKDGDGTAGMVVHTQAEFDALINKAHGKAKGQAERDFKKWLDAQAMSETDKAKAESAEKDAAVAEAKRDALEARVESAAERMAITAGVPAKRVEKFLRALGIKLDDVTDDGKVDKDAIKALIDAEVKDDPAWMAGASNGNGAGGGAGKSGGEFNGSGDKKVWTRAEIAKLSTAEFDKHEAEIMAQMKAGGIK